MNEPFCTTFSSTRRKRMERQNENSLHDYNYQLIFSILFLLSSNVSLSRWWVNSYFGNFVPQKNNNNNFDLLSSRLFLYQSSLVSRKLWNFFYILLIIIIIFWIFFRVLKNFEVFSACFVLVRLCLILSILYCLSLCVEDEHINSVNKDTIVARKIKFFEKIKNKKLKRLRRLINLSKSNLLTQIYYNFIHTHTYAYTEYTLFLLKRCLQ